MSRALVVRLSRLRDIGRPHVWSTGRIPLPFPPAPCHFARFGGERDGRAELDEYCKTQTNGRDSLSTFPANADVLGASAWVDHWQAVPPVPKYLQIPTPPFATLGSPCPLFLPTPVNGLQAKKVRSGDCELRRSLVVGDLSQPLVSSLYALAQVAPTVDLSTVAVWVVLGPWGTRGVLCLNPPMARPFLFLCGSSLPICSQICPACQSVLSCQPVDCTPFSARTCRVVFCRVSCSLSLGVRVCGLSPLPSCSFVRSVPCTATNQTAAVPFPPLLPRLRTLSLSPHKSRPIDFSPAASQPASPVQPSHWKPSLLSQLISQLSQLDAKPQPSSRQPSSPSLLLPSSASPRSQKQGPRSRSRSTPSTPRDLEATDIQRAKEQRQIVVIYWTCPPALAHRHHLAQRGDNPFRSTSFSACLNCLLASSPDQPTCLTQPGPVFVEAIHCLVLPPTAHDNPFLSRLHQFLHSSLSVYASILEPDPVPRPLFHFATAAR